jgi:hypothetical protein
MDRMHRLKDWLRAVLFRVPEPVRVTAGRAQPMVLDSTRSALGKIPGLTGLSGQIRLLSVRVTDLEDELQRDRRVNRGLAEVLDLVEEVVIPSVLQHGHGLDTLVDSYAAAIGGAPSSAPGTLRAER